MTEREKMKFLFDIIKKLEQVENEFTQGNDEKEKELYTRMVACVFELDEHELRKHLNLNKE